MNQGDRNQKKPKKPSEPRIFSKEVVDQIRDQIIRGVGYRSAPVNTQFKKGQSGNPKGRPKRIDYSEGSALRLFKQEAERMVAIREGDKVYEAPVIVAVYRAEAASASKGNSRSQGNIGARYERAVASAERERKNWIEAFEYYIASSNRQIANAKARGEELPLILPHPDDIIVGEHLERGFKIVGPATQEQLNDCMEHVKVRDLLLKQNALDYKLAAEQHLNEHFPGGCGAAYGFAVAMNTCLPKRFRLTEFEIEWNARKFHGESKRSLLKELYRGWRAVGCRVPRGAAFPMIKSSDVLALLETLVREFSAGLRQASGVEQSKLHVTVS